MFLKRSSLEWTAVVHWLVWKSTLPRRVLAGLVVYGGAHSRLPRRVLSDLLMARTNLPGHGNPGPVLPDRKVRFPESKCPVSSMQKSPRKLEPVWLYSKGQNNKGYQLEASGLRPEICRSSEAQPLAVPALEISGHKPQGELEEVGSEVTWPTLYHQVRK